MVGVALASAARQLTKRDLGGYRVNLHGRKAQETGDQDLGPARHVECAHDEHGHEAEAPVGQAVDSRRGVGQGEHDDVAPALTGRARGLGPEDGGRLALEQEHEKVDRPKKRRGQNQCPQHPDMAHVYGEEQ